jgi:D-glycero-D-manno-heptose 1,7-bisphosphate phosphatase
MNASGSRPALFLDRDGVLNRDRGYVARVEDFEWIDGAVDCIRNFNARGWYVFVVTNQTGIAFDYYTLDDMTRLHDWMTASLIKQGAHIDHIYYCPYHEDGENPLYRRHSEDRKPRPGMMLRAIAEYPVDVARSFMIGDKAKDIHAAGAAGIAGFLFTGGNLAEFAEWALGVMESASGTAHRDDAEPGLVVQPGV